VKWGEVPGCWSDENSDCEGAPCRRKAARGTGNFLDHSPLASFASQPHNQPVPVFKLSYLTDTGWTGSYHFRHYSARGISPCPEMLFLGTRRRHMVRTLLDQAGLDNSSITWLTNGQLPLFCRIQPFPTAPLQREIATQSRAQCSGQVAAREASIKVISFPREIPQISLFPWRMLSVVLIKKISALALACL
jgi:hypothetical protein